MPAALPPILASKLKGYLLLGVGANVTPNCLAMLGLTAKDFPEPNSLKVHYEPDGIYVQAKAFTTEPAERIMTHPDLVALDPDADDRVVYSFQWPQDISGARPQIQKVFPETEADPLWDAFVKGWAEITALMPPPEPSLASQTGEGDEGALFQQPVDAPPLGPSYEDSMDLTGDLDLGGSNEPILDFQGNDQVTVLAVQTTAEPESKIQVIHGAGNPAVEAAAQQVLDAQEVKRGRGRPKGTTKAAKEQKAELKAEDFTPTTDGIPALQKFAAFATEELARLQQMVDGIGGSDFFPHDSIEALKNSLDRLANRTAHLQFKGKHDDDAPDAINPLLEVTLVNITSIFNNALRDLHLAPERPESWKTFAKESKVAIDKAGSAEDMMSQPGAGPAIQEIQPRDGDGRAIA